VRAADVTGLAIAAGAQGHSVALARRERVAFLELERDADADKVARALGGVRGEVPLAVPRRGLGIAAAAVTTALAGTAAVHVAAALLSWGSDLKSAFGLASVVLAQVSAILAIVRPRATARIARGEGARVAGQDAHDAHVRLHAAAAPPAAGRPVAALASAAIGPLARRDEPTAAWLLRLDALPAPRGAYRGAAGTVDVLWETLADDLACPDERAAAARLLRRRFGEDEAAIARVVRDPEIRVRALAAMEDAEDAAPALDALGPVFRAR
jgi:hypothetical protein